MRRAGELARRAAVAGLLIAVPAGLTGCLGDTTTSGPSDTVPVSISVYLQGSLAGPQKPATAFDIRVIDGQNELVMEEIDVVVGTLRLKPGEATSCGAGACREYLNRAALLPLPTGGSPLLLATASLPVDRYDRLDVGFQVPPTGSPILQDNPDFEGVSIRVQGTFNGEEFTYESDLTTDIAMDLDPAVVLDEESSSANVTFRVDARAWFRASDASLIDPRTAGPGGQNESVVASNIQNSFEAFQDDDRDGSPGSGDPF